MPAAAQAGAVIVETGSTAGGLLMDKIDKIEKVRVGVSHSSNVM